MGGLKTVNILFPFFFHNRSYVELMQILFEKRVIRCFTCLFRKINNRLCDRLRRYTKYKINQFSKEIPKTSFIYLNETKIYTRHFIIKYVKRTFLIFNYCPRCFIVLGNTWLSTLAH